MNFAVFVAHKVEISEKLVPLMLPDVIIVLIDIMVAESGHKFFATLQRKLNNATSSFGIKTFHPRSAVFFVFHAEPLKDANAGCNTVVVDKCGLFFIIG